MNIDNFWSVLERKHNLNEQLSSIRDQITDHERQIKELEQTMERTNQ